MEERNPTSTPTREMEAVVRKGNRGEVSCNRVNTVENSVSHVNRFFLERREKVPLICSHYYTL